MASTSDTSVSIIKLVKSNYPRWLREVRALLGESGLLKHVEPTAQAVSAYEHMHRESRARGSSVESKEGAAPTADEKEVYDKQYVKATRILLTTASEEVKAEVEATHPWDLWTAYRDVCQPKQLAGSQALIMDELKSIEFDPEKESISKFLPRLKDVRRNYEIAFETRLNDGQMNHHFLNALPLKNEVWKSFKMSHFTYSGKFDALADEAKMHESSAKAHIKNSSSSGAVSNNNNNSAAMSAQEHVGGKPKSFQGKCYACGKIGHRATDCRKKKHLHCDFCNARGHVAKVCKRKRFCRKEIQTEQTLLRVISIQ